MPYFRAASTAAARWKSKWTKLAPDSTINKIIGLVEEARNNAAPTQQFINRVQPTLYIGRYR